MSSSYRCTRVCWFRFSLGYFGYNFCMFYLYKASLFVLWFILCFWCIFSCLFCFEFSVPMQVIAWKDSSPKWPIMCQQDIKLYSLIHFMLAYFQSAFYCRFKYSFRPLQATCNGSGSYFKVGAKDRRIKSSVEFWVFWSRNGMFDGFWGAKCKVLVTSKSCKKSTLNAWATL